MLGTRRFNCNLNQIWLKSPGGSKTYQHCLLEHHHGLLDFVRPITIPADAGRFYVLKKNKRALVVVAGNRLMRKSTEHATQYPVRLQNDVPLTVIHVKPSALIAANCTLETQGGV